MLCYPTQAKKRLEWGTQPLLLVQGVDVVTTSNFLCTPTTKGGCPIQAVFWLEWDTQHSMHLFSGLSALLLQNGFCQVAWMVYINPVLDRQLVGKQLQRYHLQHGR